MVGIAVAVAACGRATIGSCDDDLGGVYADGSGSRWMILDSGSALEAYPLFDDYRRLAGSGTTTEVAPRSITLARPRLAGELRRRYTRYPGGATCSPRAAVRITACSDDRLELVLTDPPAPLSYQPCAYAPTPAHVERWSRL